jgi:hypothetical protein
MANEHLLNHPIKYMGKRKVREVNIILSKLS